MRHDARAIWVSLYFSMQEEEVLQTPTQRKRQSRWKTEDVLHLVHSRRYLHRPDSTQHTAESAAR